jgi:hypothetical protein
MAGGRAGAACARDEAALSWLSDSSDFSSSDPSDHSSSSGSSEEDSDSLSGGGSSWPDGVAMEDNFNLADWMRW